MAGPKGPQTLLLTTNKDGQQTAMVVQQPNSVADCNVTTAVLNSINSSPQVITINKPLTQQSGVNSQPQQILVSNTPGCLPTNMVLNMNNINTSRAVTPSFVNASATVNNQNPRGPLGQRVVLNNSAVRFAPQQTMHLQRPGAPLITGPVS